MKHLSSWILPLTCALLLAAPARAISSWTLDLEAAMVNAEKNDVAVPNATGTRFSLTDDLSLDEDVAFRVELGLRLGRRHTLAALYAPLRLHASGALDEDVLFNGRSFTAGNELDAVYQFNSYRLRWTYDLVQRPKFILGLGLTAKVRDAYIEVSDADQTSRFDDLGFVPLLNLRLDWRFSRKVGLLLQADALASPSGEGRAEDVLAAVAVRPWGAGTFRLGYRFVEGGVDVEDVYNFAFINYYVFGWSQRF
jgi:hypothetical protein